MIPRILISTALVFCLVFGLVGVAAATSPTYVDLEGEAFGGRSGVRISNMDTSRLGDRVDYVELWFLHQDDDYISEGSTPATGPGAVVHMWIDSGRPREMPATEPDYTLFLYGLVGDSPSTRTSPWMHLWGFDGAFEDGTFLAVSLQGRFRTDRDGAATSFRGTLTALLPGEGEAQHLTVYGRVGLRESTTIGPTMLGQPAEDITFNSVTLSSVLSRTFGGVPGTDIEGQFRWAETGGNWTVITWEEGTWVSANYTDATLDDLDDDTDYIYQVRGRFVWGATPTDGAWSGSVSFTTDEAVAASLSTNTTDYDLENPADVVITITWNEGDSIVSIYDDIDDGNLLTVGGAEDYTIETNTLTFLNATYLATDWDPSENDVLVLTINFRWGASSTLTITCIDTA